MNEKEKVVRDLRVAKDIVEALAEAGVTVTIVATRTDRGEPE